MSLRYPQDKLPGMPSRQAQPKRSTAQYRYTSDERYKANVDPRGKYSGPIPGQMVMGVHDLGGDAMGHPSRRGYREPFYEVDHTGMVQDAGRGAVSWVRPVEIAARTNHVPADRLYNTLGGAFDDDAHVRAHWASQPLQQISTSAPIHTGQNPWETTGGRNVDTQTDSGEFHRIPEGRYRVNAIRSSLQNGQPLRKAAWLVKHSGRLYALDGHHRILAAREEGHESFPAHVWDWDAERR